MPKIACELFLPLRNQNKGHSPCVRARVCSSHETTLSSYRHIQHIQQTQSVLIIYPQRYGSSLCVVTQRLANAMLSVLDAIIPTKREQN